MSTAETALRPIDFAECRASAEQRVMELRQKRGRSILDNDTFDDAALQAAERAIDGLDDAEVETRRQASHAAAMAEQECLVQLRATLDAANERRLRALDKAETAAFRMVGDLREFFAASQACYDAGRALGPAPLSLMRAECEMRAGVLVARALRTVSKSAHWFGDIELPPASIGFATGSWVDCERRASASALSTPTLIATRDHPVREEPIPLPQGENDHEQRSDSIDEDGIFEEDRPGAA